MSFLDMIKNSVVQEFTGTISVGEILFSLAIAFLASVFIIYVYRKTYSGVVYSKSFSLCLIMLAMVTSLIIRTINSNLALSLGMVGALSIVRFRTAVKEPIDTGFMFWAITVGIMSGAGLYLITATSCLALGILFFISYLMGFKTKSQYLLVLKYNSSIDEEVTKAISNIPKTKLKSKSIIKTIVETTYEIEIEDINDILSKFENKNDVISASAISYQNDFGA